MNNYPWWNEEDDDDLYDDDEEYFQKISHKTRSIKNRQETIGKKQRKRGYNKSQDYDDSWY